MRNGRAERSAAVWQSMLVGTALVVHQVAGKATRDALFLSVFGVSSLPWMMIGSSLLTIVAIVGASSVMMKRGPTHLLPRACMASAVLHVIERFLFGYGAQNIAGVAVYLHMSIAPVLIVGFWSTLSEGLDPRANRREMARVATASAFGGLLGGLLAWFRDVSVMLPVLAGIHALCAIAAYLRRPVAEFAAPTTREMVDRDQTATGRSLGVMLRETPYLGSLALTVLLCAASAALLDVAFKAHAWRAFPTRVEMMHVFSIFYTSTALLALLVQFLFASRALVTVGLVGTAAALPLSVVLGSALGLLLPGLVTASVARGSEIVTRNSLFRSAYEPLFAAVPSHHKNASKTYVDVGFERLGDLLGAGLAQAFLVLGILAAVRWQFFTAMVLAAAALFLAQYIHRGYQDALRLNLARRTITPEPALLLNSTSGPIVASYLDESRRADHAAPLDVLSQIASVSSGDSAEIEKVLGGGGPIPTRLVPHVIPLLGSDVRTAALAIEALRGVATENAGQLVDRLRDRGLDLRIRCRIPRVLAASHSNRSVEGLVAGLRDPDFEIRRECARALARMLRKDAKVHLSREQVFGHVVTELEAGQELWATHRLPGAGDEDQSSLFIDERLGRRGDRSLEHVFILLSLVLPPGEPLLDAFRALHTSDPSLRGTALDYLETVLPRPLRMKLWPFLEADPDAMPKNRSRREARQALLESHPTIETHLSNAHDGVPAREA